MSHSFLVYSAPAETAQGLKALSEAERLLNTGETIEQVFFYGPAVSYASCFLEFPSGLPNMQQRWLDLAQQYQFPLIVCATAGNQYGLQAELPPQGNLQSGFNAAGLTEFITSLARSSALDQF
ncbi:DsrE/DsrF/TusD sulfur relay family protein [Aliidiomarina celeris]|uniref:DsrE/DsrF/TusD sulfur relay family protein n=1 Tax=Aliidiomarina celeris TaxID=2249428 RepID=UPI000DE884A2|nr:DsrE family protein [Aliidiomarina celeris]